MLLVAPLSGSAITQHATVYFSPDDQLDKRLIDEIYKETNSICICIYTFTHRAVAEALIEAKKRGVDVEIVVDRFSVKVKAQLQKLTTGGIPVHVWDPDRFKRKSPYRPLMHNKFCVFGSDKVWTGSFNFTDEASKIHQENALVIQDIALASAYKGQFQTIKLRCIPLSAYMAIKSKKLPQISKK
jgi:phosphatidylserine/phosphatidylglycerophosphate/cardiolipin synthase-like enzyme